MIPILFVFLPFRDDDYRFRFHLGVGYIQAYLEDRGISSSQYLPKKRTTLFGLVDDILKQKPRIVGFTCYDSNYYIVKSVTEALKKRKSDLPLVVGGPTATFSDRFILEDCPSIDICVRGDGEETVYELIEAYPKDLSRVKGITFREKNTIVRVADRPLAKGEKRGAELDVLPSPYLKGLAPMDGQSGILTSRGCVYNCTFCNFSAMSRHSIRYHSIERVIAELLRINEYTRINYKTQRKPLVEFNDDAFSLNTERAKEICRRIIDERIMLNFYADTRADFCDNELLELMRKAGFAEINFGLESATPKVLRNVKKVSSSCLGNLAPERQFLRGIKKNINIARKLGFHTSVSVILGLPGETIEDAKKTLSVVEELGVDEYSHNFLKIHSGTELFETYGNYRLGIEKSATILPHRVIYPYNVYELTPLVNASLQKFIIEDEATYFELVANALDVFEGKDWLNLLVYETALQNGLAPWLAKFATLPFSLYLCKTRGRLTPGTASKYVSELVRRRVPIGNFYILKESHQIKQVTNAMELMRYGESIWSRSVFVEIPFSMYQARPLLPESTKVILTITNKEDVKALIDLVGKSFSSKSVSISYPHILTCVKDECRWASEPCPAMKLHRLILRKDSSIATCFDGCVMGGLNSSRKKVKAAIVRTWQKELLRRNCSKCSVKDYCSKCFFTFPLTAMEFCNLRKNNPEIGDFIDLLRATRLLLKDGSPLREKRVQIAAMPVRSKKYSELLVEKCVRLVRLGRSQYAVNARTQRVFKLNESTANFLRALLAGTDLQHLKMSFAWEHEAKEKRKFDFFTEEALRSFEERGFLKSLH